MAPFYLFAFSYRNRRLIAKVLLLIWIINLTLPVTVYGLTTGPAQPETLAFQPAGVADMVDLKSGDFKYNIPLMDIDGYPLNLSYQSGSGMEDEASWVGFGWVLNPGAINRQVRGVPDDMYEDKTTVEHFTKPSVTVGARMTTKTELFGIGFLTGSASLSYGIYTNNYTGFGAEFSPNAGISASKFTGGLMTASLGIGLTSDSQKGVDVSPKASLDFSDKMTENMLNIQGLSANLGYNTRSGMKSLGLGGSFGPGVMQKLGSGLGTNFSYNTEAVNPKIAIPYASSSNSYSLDGGFALWGSFEAQGITGYRTTRQVAQRIIERPMYGLLYADRGKNEPDAVMDFIRENENPVIPELPNLALPIHTPDMFAYTGQAGSGQFRLYRGGTGAFFDSFADDQNKSSSDGLDIGAGPNDIHAGVTVFDQEVHNYTRKWTKANGYLANGDFQDLSLTNFKREHAYFKEIGEMTAQDPALASAMGNTAPVMVQLGADNRALPNFVGASSQKIERQTRQPKKTLISYLTATEATHGGLDSVIYNYQMLDKASLPAVLPAKPVLKNAYLRVDPSKEGGKPLPDVALYPNVNDDVYPVRKFSHLSEITVTDPSGKRMVYGLPVYNISQTEKSFALGTGYSKTGNRVAYPGRDVGVDKYFHRETKSPYATSFLLTGILSPDYVDLKNDGITDDDQGTAIKFNYSKTSYNFNWRTPYDKATLNRGLLADPDDDKGSIIYGEKELWYINSIETKTKIVYFITEDRLDGLGVNSEDNGGPNSDKRQRRLAEVRLYSKADMTRPIKVVKFEYDYSLFGNVPNYLPKNGEASTGGKLTLKKIWFEYRNIDRGKYHYYEFNYNGGSNYKDQATDRWGMYKDPSENLNAALTNEEFPYAGQKNKSTSDVNAGMWQLSNIRLPTGGDINVDYEADDYAYVQNRKAMAMYAVNGFYKGTASSPQVISNTQSDGALYDMKALRLDLPSAKMPSASEPSILNWFKRNLLNGSDYLYTKLYVKMKTKNNATVPDAQGYDYVPCYAKVVDVKAVSQSGENYLLVYLENFNDEGINTNTIMHAALQRLKNEYPRYAYPGFSRKEDGTNSGGILAILNAVLTAIGNLGELFKNFYQTAQTNKYATWVDLNKSFVRLAKYDGYTTGTQEVIAKIGGGARVKAIRIADNWVPNEPSKNNPNPQVAVYGQSYAYTTTENGKVISSGVASYEPGVGGDENPFKMPVPVVQKIKGGINNYFDLEEPFGESVFPAPGVTYSKVTVRDLVKTGSNTYVADPDARTGYIVNEFYTTRDFPVKVNVLPIDPRRYTPHSYFSFIKTVSDDEMIMSQGYSIELNDMDGKPEAVRTFNQAGAQIAATEYYYRSTDVGGGSYKLNNNVPIVSENGTVTNGVIGQEIELFGDFREQESISKGRNINIGSETILFLIYPTFLPHLPIKLNDNYRLFRSACMVKVIQSYGILEKVVKIQNGSSVATENLAFDGKTGDPLVTRTLNEFKRPIYTTNIPAYWAYKGMSGGYQSNGVMLKDITTDASGVLTAYNSDFSPGDEMIDLDQSKEGNPYLNGQHYWMVEQSRSGLPTKRYLMDAWGVIQKNFTSSLVKIIRSGNRNILDAGITQIVSLNNPIVNNKLLMTSDIDLTNALKVINASANTYDETWANTIPNLRVLPTETPINFNLYDAYNSTETLTGVEINNAAVPTAARYKLEQRAFYASIRDNPSNPIYSQSGSTPGNKNAMGIVTTFNAPAAGQYYIGMAAYPDIWVKVGSTVCPNDGNWTTYAVRDQMSRRKYRIYPVNLVEGENQIRIEVAFRGGDPYNTGLLDGFSVEIYNNSYDDLYFSQDPNVLRPIFSTRSLVYVPNVKTQVYLKDLTGRETYQSYYDDVRHTSYGSCALPVTSVNPYVFGYAGNWKLYKTKVFQQNRNYANLTDPMTAAVDVKNAGYIKNFFSDWYYNVTTGIQRWIETSASSRWTTANTVTLYDKFGQQLENKDAMGRFSAALFAFNGELPAAVSSNARNRDIYTNAFEDGYFVYGLPIWVDPDSRREFAQIVDGAERPLKNLMTGSLSHSGNYSIAVGASGITINTRSYSGMEHKTFPYFDYNSSSEYIKHPQAAYPKGFEPSPGNYIINFWVKDSRPFDKSFNEMTVKANNITIPLVVRASAEGWKLLEGSFDVPAVAGRFSLTLQSQGNTVNIDDLRIHPKDAQMKTYAYDEKTLRLMAELDENALATFYEYDNQGLLIRVKKETEKGVVTLKETRSSYIKKN